MKYLLFLETFLAKVFQFIALAQSLNSFFRFRNETIKSYNLKQMTRERSIKIMTSLKTEEYLKF